MVSSCISRDICIFKKNTMKTDAKMKWNKFVIFVHVKCNVPMSMFFLSEKYFNTFRL